MIGLDDRPSQTISSSPVHFNFDPNLPLAADHIAAGKPLIGRLQRAVRREIGPQAGHHIRTRQDTRIEDQRILWSECIIDVPFFEHLE